MAHRSARLTSFGLFLMDNRAWRAGGRTSLPRSRWVSLPQGSRLSKNAGGNYN